MEKQGSEWTLFDLGAEIWKARFWIVFLALAFSALGFLFLAMANPYVKGEMIIAPATPIGKHPQATADFEGIIQLQTGVMTGSAAFTRFEALYNGVSVAESLLGDQTVLEGLAKDLPFRFSAPPDVGRPDLLAVYLKKRLKLEPVAATPLRRLVYLHPDPVFAAYLIGRIHRITDEMIRVSILEEVNGRITYLSQALARTQNADHRRALTDLLMEQERLKMLVSLDQPYAAAIVEPPSAARRTVWPDKYLVFAIFAAVGVMIGFVIHATQSKDAQ